MRRVARVLCPALFVALAALFATVADAGDGGRLTIVKPVGFDEDAMVRKAVLKECNLETKVPDFVAAYAKGHFSEVSFAEAAGSGPGKVLILQIEDTNESGNAFTGRSKSLTISGELRESGEVIGTFRARRSTGGGFMGQYKGNCSFLGRCAKALGQDVARWLEKPGMDDVLQN